MGSTFEKNTFKESNVVSTLNDDDYQQKHKEALEALTQIESEFARLRDKMYEEKLLELNKEATMIENGTHPQLIALMAEIKEKREIRIHNAEAWRRYQLAHFKQQYEGFEYQANIHFISQKNALRRRLFQGLYDQKWRMEDEQSRSIDSLKDYHKETTETIQDTRIGFPKAPTLNGLDSKDRIDDLKLFGLL